MITLFNLWLRDFGINKHNGKYYFYLPPCSRDSFKFSAFIDVVFALATLFYYLVYFK